MDPKAFDCKWEVYLFIYFCRYNTRHVALKIVYLGWDYQGFAAQEDTNKTIEHALFQALHRTKLIESRYTLNPSVHTQTKP